MKKGGRNRPVGDRLLCTVTCRCGRTGTQYPERRRLSARCWGSRIRGI